MNAPVSTPAVIAAKRSIGAVLMDAGRLRAEDAERVLRVVKEQGLRFGDAALQLGVIAQNDLDFALAQQFNYPYLAPSDQSIAKEVQAAFSPDSRATEALRALRTQLMLRWFDGSLAQKALAVTSAEHGDGRSWLAANLAVVFSQLGERTLLIDADLRRPRQHALFCLENRLGLSSILAERADVEAICALPALPSLSVLPAGAIPPNPHELLARPAFARLLDQARAQFDLVIIDTPPLGDYADGQTVAMRSGAALVVARRNISRIARLKLSADTLAQSGAQVLGSVVNEF